MKTMILIYYAVINIVLFAAMGIDKSKAVHNKWRIPEANLFKLAFFGGGAGGFLGMLAFRHKTKKPKFYFIFTLALLLHGCLLINYYKLFDFIIKMS
ncbi:MAG: DUF1294 domain-containing protein [Clostridiales bacterium]|nr:DUF1294 domain-containing protein [Clostridiales bacterium]